LFGLNRWFASRTPVMPRPVQALVRRQVLLPLVTDRTRLSMT